MPQYASPPPELAAAIQQASGQYDVPQDVLTGIWRIESGSTYPNPAVNSIGYGGLFGTKDWNGPTQEQANLSASILHNLLVKDSGYLPEALKAYSGGGYTHVPGQTSPDRVADYWNHSVGQIGKGKNKVGDILNTPGQALQTVTNFLANPLSALERGLLVGGGFLLVLIGLFIVARSFGVSGPRLPLVAAAEGYVAGRARGGRSGSQGSPRRQGDAAIDRGEEVTRTGAPEHTTNVERRKAAVLKSGREREARRESRARDKEFGDVPF